MKSDTTGITFDTRLTGALVQFFDEDALWQSIVPKIYAPSVLTKYPVFDPNMEAFRVLPKSGLKKVGRAKPGTVSSGRELEKVIIEPYFLMSDLIPEQDIQEDRLLDIDAVTTEGTFVLQTLNTQMDVDLFNLMTSAAAWTDTPAPVKWNLANGDPENDVLTICDSIETSNGGKKRPNTMVMGRTAFRAMISRNNKMRSDLKYVIADREDMITIIKGLFTLDTVVVVPTAKNTALKGATPSMSAVWGSKVWIGHMANNAPSRANSSAVYAVILKIGNTNQNGIAATRIKPANGMAFEDGTKGEKVLVEVYTNFFACSSKLAQTISDVY